MPKTSLAASLLIIVACLLAAAQANGQGSLEKDFRSPPEVAKSMTWWHWMNGNVTKEGITADLEAMKRIGLGGAQIFNVSQGEPKGPDRGSYVAHDGGWKARLGRSRRRVDGNSVRPYQHGTNERPRSRLGSWAGVRQIESRSGKGAFRRHDGESYRRRRAAGR